MGRLQHGTGGAILTTQQDIDNAVAFAKNVVGVVGVLAPFVPGAGAAIALGAQVATGALNEVPEGEALWADIQAVASGAAAPSPAVLAASVAASTAANDQLANDDAAALAAEPEQG